MIKNQVLEPKLKCEVGEAKKIKWKKQYCKINVQTCSCLSWKSSINARFRKQNCK